MRVVQRIKHLKPELDVVSVFFSEVVVLEQRKIGIRFPGIANVWQTAAGIPDGKLRRVTGKDANRVVE